MSAWDWQVAVLFLSLVQVVHVVIHGMTTRDTMKALQDARSHLLAESDRHEHHLRELTKIVQEIEAHAQLRTGPFR